jgi:3-hydroxybutyryl-CoA dehydratase
MVRDLTLIELVEGAHASFQHGITVADVDTFAQLSGDISPIHMDAAYARAHGYPKRVVHGALLAAFASRLIGTELPGRRALLLSLRLDYPAPTFVDDVVQVSATVTSVHPAQQSVRMRLLITCGAEVRAQGSALVRVQDAA